MARTARATVKSKQRRKEAADDRRADVANDADRAGAIEDGGDREEASRPAAKSGLVVKRPGMDDLKLDELAACPAPEDALLLLSPETAEAMHKLPLTALSEVCKTIVALGDVVARTHAPTLAAIKLSLREDGGILSTAEANGRVFYRRGDAGLIPGFSGAICALARAEAKQRKGAAHVEALDAWGNALVEAGQYLAEIAATARSIAEEMAQADTKQPDPGVVRSQVGRGGRKCCTKDERCIRDEQHVGDCQIGVISPQPVRCRVSDDCALEAGHKGDCMTAEEDAEVDAIADRLLGKTCGKRHSEQEPGGCSRPKEHAGSCSFVYKT